MVQSLICISAWRRGSRFLAGLWAFLLFSRAGASVYWFRSNAFVYD